MEGNKSRLLWFVAVGIAVMANNIQSSGGCNPQWIKHGRTFVSGGVANGAISQAGCKTACQGSSGCQGILWYQHQPQGQQCFTLTTQSGKVHPKAGIINYDYNCISGPLPPTPKPVVTVTDRKPVAPQPPVVARSPVAPPPPPVAPQPPVVARSPVAPPPPPVADTCPSVLSIDADDHIDELYFDGCLVKPTLTPNAMTYNVADNVSMPANTKVIAVHITNLGGPGGLVASTDAAASPLITDGTWKVSQVYSPGWMNPAFDDSHWAPASTYGFLSNSNVFYGGDQGVVATAYWIASTNANSMFDTYYRKKL